MVKGDVIDQQVLESLIHTHLLYFHPLSFSLYLIFCDVLALLHCASSKGGREVAMADEIVEEFWKIQEFLNHLR